MAEDKKAEEILKEAQRLYNEGKWTEAVRLIVENNNHISNSDNSEYMAEGLRISGWSFYYLGIKGSEEEKVKYLFLSTDAFAFALYWTDDDGKKISIANGISLAFWKFERQTYAWWFNNEAIKVFAAEPSVWNTRSILLRWEKRFEESVDVCEKVFETAVAKGDYRTAGHGKQNKADALKELGRIEEAKIEYLKAIELYKRFEQRTKESAKFHVEGVEKKLSKLN